MIDLSVTFQGITFPNPFLVGSGPTTGNPPKIISAIRAGWGGVVVKTIGDSIVRKSVRPMYATIRRNREIIAFENLELITEDPLEVWDKYLRVIKSEIGKSAPIIVSIMGGPDYSEWIRLARWAEDRGADMLELNFGCPHGEPEKRTGAFIGQHADLVQEYTKEVVSSVGIPVIAKLTPNITDIRETAKAAENAGAKAVTAINTVNGVIAVDIERAQPLPDINGYSGYGGISGPAVKPIGLAAVSKIYTSTSLQISGVGGIFDWRDAVEYIMMGATTVQSVTYTILKGFEFINEWKKELESFMERKGYRAIEDMRGLAAKKMTTYEVLEKVTKRRTSVDEEINTVRDETHG
ncbi:NAD-dependent dihydropyrimidine dehydrogenase subunit PreA [Sulfurisphaera tokodaii]|uniref:Dihydroorotate dehydrogenase B (NAD(+)), catalytic subunit n=2 Tax=Sulfurisphaera tokodaii TaxID=111955 RepID=Q972L2_SULTO|nr:NAD-dependent dihydropyrimidine dehydrogenase subunit PreA [Sulfurisphaera tokodaii]BAB66153.1 dihydropyrimidine dehydrogenase [Sulfurisphaera tokodaii str. 7]HII74650.1 NAD-dependent dihydropyrimidine dehydrogenase subunit PreA [Sulfurisphaera tokodaii]